MNFDLTDSTPKPKQSYFDQHGLEKGIDLVLNEIIEVYKSDDLPWIVGYSGGKDSTAVLQLVWMALAKMKPLERTKPVHVISTDTLVENPIVAAWVNDSLKKMDQESAIQEQNIKAHRLTPDINNSFWVNLIGRGYPAPRQNFRWCTERLKISPASKFISSVVDKYGETMIVLGVRKAESKARAQSIEKFHAEGLRDKVNNHTNLPNSFIFSPIQDWQNDDVWMFLLETTNPWGHDNNDLFTMYKGASADGECPLVVSSGTPSCGDSRFGCWVCTLVDKDRSMSAMIRNDEEKAWMTPLLKIREKIDFRTMENEGDFHLRDFRRMSGKITIVDGRAIHGPYKQSFREELLTELLTAQTFVQKTGPKYVNNLELITLDELEEIRRIWVIDKHELEDSLPNIYETATKVKYPGKDINAGVSFGSKEMKLLEKLCDNNRLLYEMMRELISIEEVNKTSKKRTNIFTDLEKAITKNYYDSEKEAVEYTLKKLKEKEERKHIWLTQNDS